MPQRIHIVGCKNSGKTTLVCELVSELTRRGLRVGTVKHTHHRHELDTPGKDSWRHRDAGAAAVGILSPGMTALFVPTERSAGRSTESADYALLDASMSECDLVLVEGDLQATAPRVEVWRAVTSDRPYAAADATIRLLISDDKCNHVSCPCIPRSGIEDVADALLALQTAST
jgi:molybdopterin-guanine dinucleotide biosynthesis protein B